MAEREPVVGQSGDGRWRCRFCDTWNGSADVVCIVCDEPAGGR